LCSLLLFRTNSDRNAFFAGFPFTSLVVNIPQRFQSVNGVSASRAGISLMPLLLMTPFASALSGLLVSNRKFRVPPLYLVLLGSSLQLIGVGLDSSISTNVEDGIQKIQYAYEVFMGLGFGLVLSSLLTFIPLVVDKKDTPVVSPKSQSIVFYFAALASSLTPGCHISSGVYPQDNSSTPNCAT
jgi:hypothetical protein